MSVDWNRVGLAEGPSRGADKAYNNCGIRTYLREHGIRHAILEKPDQSACRLRRGPRGGRPPWLDKDRYKKRNTVERTIATS
ncbi:hypothetical protein [Streptomyces sp. NBC_01166]|uniref:hypothetical protein n=1 Tax=Streptomyces sp. NBC_01166 TaxID=2903755 RepID=UPI003869F41E